MKSTLALSFLAMLVFFSSSPAARGQVSEFELANGIHVLVHAIKEAEDVGVETVYQVGFMHEPKGMVQSSHLLEHLVCYSAGAGFEAKEAMAWLNRSGMANAETLPDFTHYDYAASADQLDKVLQIEAARLAIAKFDPELIKTEAKRVYQETDMVEQNPKTGMVKHAFMAFAHAWRYQSETALVRGGLETMSPAKLLEFYQQTYVPENLTIVITGKTTRQQAEQLVKKHFGDIKSTKPLETKLDWAGVPPHQDVQWDAKHQAVCVAWAPPKTKEDQVIISLLGAVAAQGLMKHPDITANFEMVMCSNNLWTAGVLPIFVYGLAKPGKKLSEAQSSLEAAFKEELEAAARDRWQMVGGFAHQLEFQRKPSPWTRMQQSAKMLERMGRMNQKPMQMVLTQAALNRALQHHTLGADADTMLQKIKGQTSEDLQAIIPRYLREKTRRSVHLRPLQK